MKLSTNLIWFFVLAVAGFCIYSPGLGIQYYADDLFFVSKEPFSKIFYYFSHPVAGNFYRPFEGAFLGIVQTFFGLETWPIHLTHIVVHILLCWLIFVSMLRLGLSRTEAIFGSGFMLVSQANVNAVLGNDGIAQQCGTFFGYLSLCMLYRCLFEPKNSIDSVKRLFINRHYLCSILIYGLSLLSKESSISFLPLLFGIVFLKNLKIKNKNWKTSINRVIIQSLPFVIITILYLIVRRSVINPTPILGSERYQFHIGINIFKNLAMLLFSALLPTSSVTTFLAFKNGELAIFLSIAAIALTFFICIVYGLWRSKRAGMVLVLSIFSVLSLFPMAALNHVSELYPYNSMFFIAILLGISLGRWFELSKKNLARQTLFAAVIAILCISHIRAIQSKALLMKLQGEKAAILLKQILPFIPEIPKGASLLLLNTPAEQPKYSVYLSTGFNALLDGENRINQLSGRDDFRVRIVDQQSLEEAKSKSGPYLILWINKGAVQIYQSLLQRFKE